jgi:Spy/CpxP family protein refolding chaperone
MKLTRIVALAGMVALAAPAAFAQGGGQGGGQGRGIERLMTGITLTDKQKASVDSIDAAFRAQMPARTPGQQMDSTARAKMMEVRQKEYAEIKKVLTPDQQKTFDKNVEDMRANMSRPRP